MPSPTPTALESALDRANWLRNTADEYRRTAQREPFFKLRKSLLEAALKHDAQADAIMSAMKDEVDG